MIWVAATTMPTTTASQCTEPIQEKKDNGQFHVCCGGCCHIKCFIWVVILVDLVLAGWFGFCGYEAYVVASLFGYKVVLLDLITFGLIAVTSTLIAVFLILAACTKSACLVLPAVISQVVYMIGLAVSAGYKIYLLATHNSSSLELNMAKIISELATCIISLLLAFWWASLINTYRKYLQFLRGN